MHDGTATEAQVREPVVDEVAKLEQKRAETADLLVELDAGGSRAMQRHVEEVEEVSRVFSLIDDDVPISADANAMALLVMLDNDDEDWREGMMEFMEALAEEEIVTLPGYIAALALLEDHVKREEQWHVHNGQSSSQSDARRLLAASEGLVTWLERDTDGAAAERELAYGLLTSLLQNRQRVRPPPLALIPQRLSRVLLHLSPAGHTVCRHTISWSWTSSWTASQLSMKLAPPLTSRWLLSR